MGQQGLKQAPVIDETFAGLARPSEIHAMGRPDIVEDRPGQALIDEVVRFEAEGGFREMARAREEERLRDAEIDASVPREKLPDFGLKGQPGDVPELEASKDSAGDN